MGRKTNRHHSSFHCKVRRTRVAARISRERRLARQTGSTVALEYQSQGRPAKDRKRGCLENPLGVSKAEARGSRGIPTEGGVEPLDYIERDQYPRPYQPRSYEDASGLQSTPSNGARVLAWITR